MLLAGKDAWNAPEGFDELCTQVFHRSVKGTYYERYKQPVTGLFIYYLQHLPEVTYDNVSTISDSLQRVSFNTIKTMDYKYFLTNILIEMSKTLTESYNNKVGSN